MLESSPRQIAKDLFLIALAATLPLLILRPLQNAPFIDDWVYAWSVEHLLKTGDLQILDSSASINVAQILWGTLFCLPFGFSFTALRLSTWVLSTVLLFGLYLTLRELGVSRRDSYFGIALLGLYPVYFLLSFTFMTDIPFLAGTVWCSYALVKTVRQRSDAWLLGASLLASATIAIRVIGVASAGALAATLLLNMGRWGRSPRRVLIASLPFVFAGLLVMWHGANIEPRAEWTSPQQRYEDLRNYGFLWLPQYIPETILFVAVQVGIVLAPLLTGCHRSVRKSLTVLCLGVLLVLFAYQAWNGKAYSPVLNGFWSFSELGMTEVMLPYYQAPSLSPALSWLLFGVALIAAALLLAVLIERRGPADWPFLWLIGGHVFLIALLWLLHDRYTLIVLPAFVALFFSRAKITAHIGPLIGLALLATFSFLGARDHLEYNGAVWKAADYLADRGIPWRAVDAGYVVNGWFQYAHIENARKDGRGFVLVPWVNVKTEQISGIQYLVSNSLLPDTTLLQRFPYRRWVGRSGAIYVLEVETADNGINGAQNRNR